MKNLRSNLKHGLLALVSLVATVGPLVAVDPQVRHAVHHELTVHPAVAAYVPAALVAVHAAIRWYRFYRLQKKAPPAAAGAPPPAP